jgi:hypothetical protein
MELLLNIIWVMLAIPACWAWQRHWRTEAEARLHPVRGLLVLVCSLVLLFPVISATDDLHPMRPEMEEAGPSKRSVKNCGSQAITPWTGGQIPAQFCAAAFRFPSPLVTIFDQAKPGEPAIARSAPVMRDAGRAPPFPVSA